MYLDKKARRVLLTNGISLVDVDDYAAKMIKEGGVLPPHIRIEDSVDSDLMFEVHGVDVGYDVDSTPEPPRPVRNSVEIHIDPDKYPRVDEMIELYGDEFIDRISDEIEFFERENSEFVLKLMDLIDKFKTDNVVWGVGRGSACASVLLYVIEVHDLDPIKHDIPFRELSKEDSDEY